MNDAAGNDSPTTAATISRAAKDDDLSAALLSLFERGIVGIAEVDSRTRRYVKVNRRYCEMVRRSEAELLSCGPRELLLPEDREAFETEWKAAGAGPGYWQGRARHVLGDGSVAWMQIGISICARDADGKPLRSVSVIQDVTESVIALDQLKLREEMLRLGQKVGRIATFVRDLANGAIICNPDSREIMGLPAGDAPLPLEVWVAVILPEDRQRIAALMADAAARRLSETAYEFRVRRPGEDEVRHFEMRARYFYDEDGRPLRSVGVAIDVTEHMRALERLRISEEMRRLGQQAGRIVTFTRDLASKTITLTSESQAILGLSGQDAKLTEREWFEMVEPEDRRRLLASIANSLERGDETIAVEYRLKRRSDGALRHIDMRGRYFYDAEGKPLRSIGVAIDVTERRLAEDQLAHAARHDALTGLPNRRLYRERVEDALARSRRGEGFALLCLDLDRFKEVNDTLGHAVGDRLLIEASQRIGELLRETDTLARLGGDEFAILQSRVAGPNDVAALAQRILASVSAPYKIEGQPALVGVSVGAALAPADGDNHDDLMRAADIALYRAKAEGRGRYAFFTPQMNANMQARRAMRMDLAAALERGEFELHYQPILEVATRRISGFEALARWRRADGKLAPPDLFIPLCEETGLIRPLGAWVLQAATLEAAGWGGGLTVAVNLSPLQFVGGKLEDDIADALAASGLPYAQLEIEITESAVLQETEATLATLARLKARGLRIAMDDFGAGYSSLSYLQRFPFDRVKIDRAFTQQVARSRKSHAIVKAMSELCDALQMSTTAEGVETEDQLRAVARIGCQDAQGYLFSRPVPASEIPALLARFGVVGGASVAAE